MITLRYKSDEIVEGVDCNVKEDVLNTFLMKRIDILRNSKLRVEWSCLSFMLLLDLGWWEAVEK